MLDNLDGILLAALLVLISRAASIYTLVPATIRLFKLPHVNMGERHIMWWGGLKGGLAIAIVLSIPESLDGRQILVELTLGVVLFTLLFNAPSIRPLITRLGLDRMSEEDIAELQLGLLEAEQRAHDVVDRLTDANLLTTKSKTTIDTTLADIFDKDAPNADTRRHFRHAYMEAIQLESEELQELYRLGLIQEYTFLDLRARLRRDKDAWANAPSDTAMLSDKPSVNPFLRVEHTALRWMRERNVLAWFLATFQRARLSQGVQRDIAGILCGEAVMKNLRLRAGLEPSDMDKVVDIYQRRVGRKRKRVDEIRGDFPEIFATLEARLTQTAALASAHNHTPMSFHHGNIGAKAFSRIERLLNSAKDRIPAITNPNAGVDPVELIEQIPLFDGLSSDAISALAARAQTVTFLMGDIVIGQNEKGNALYIIMYGIVDVFQDDDGAKTRVGTLSRGEFFGEVALLGDEVRTATVTAKTSLTLLRVTRRTVLSLAEKHADIAERLEHAHSQRR